MYYVTSHYLTNPNLKSSFRTWCKKLDISLCKEQIMCNSRKRKFPMVVISREQVELFIDRATAKTQRADYTYGDTTYSGGSGILQLIELWKGVLNEQSSNYSN